MARNEPPQDVVDYFEEEYNTNIYVHNLVNLVESLYEEREKMKKFMSYRIDFDPSRTVLDVYEEFKDQIGKAEWEQ